MKVDIALYEPITPGNIGAIARAMKNFGFKNLYLIRPQCNHLSEEAYQRACHAKDVLNNAKIITEEELFNNYVAGTTAKAFTRRAHRQAVTPDKLNFLPSNSVILLGREDNGLPNSVLEKCSAVINIPTRTRYKSMNLSHAATIIMYELSRVKAGKVVSKKLRDKLILELNNLALRVGMKRTITGFIKNIINRSVIYEKEGNALMGLIKNVKESLKP